MHFDSWHVGALAGICLVVFGGLLGSTALGIGLMFLVGIFAGLILFAVLGEEAVFAFAMGTFFTAFTAMVLFSLF